MKQRDLSDLANSGELVEDRPSSITEGTDGTWLPGGERNGMAGPVEGRAVADEHAVLLD